jgi:hypothetical protein
MSMEGLSKRVEMSLALTAANEIVAYISQQPDIDTWTMAKMAVIFTIWLVYVDSVWTQMELECKSVDREGISMFGGIRVLYTPNPRFRWSRFRQDTRNHSPDLHPGGGENTAILGTGTNSLGDPHIPLPRHVAAHKLAADRGNVQNVTRRRSHGTGAAGLCVQFPAPSLFPRDRAHHVLPTVSVCRHHHTTHRRLQVQAHDISRRILALETHHR